MSCMVRSCSSKSRALSAGLRRMFCSSPSFAETTIELRLSSILRRRFSFHSSEGSRSATSIGAAPAETAEAEVWGSGVRESGGGLPWLDGVVDTDIDDDVCI